MDIRISPLVLFTALVAAAAPAIAGAPPPSGLKPARAEVVDSDTLAQVRGKFYGADMLVGLRIELVSNWKTAGGTLGASGTLQIQRNGSGGYDVQIDSRSNAQATGAAGSLAPNASATGGDQVAVNGIGQVAQIAGDGNKFSNLTKISFTPASQAGGSFNGQSSSSASSGDMTARISFGESGIDLGLRSAIGQMSQAMNGGAMQISRIAGNDQIGSNMMQMQVLTERMSEQMQRMAGIEQALAGLQQIPR